MFVAFETQAFTTLKAWVLAALKTALKRLFTIVMESWPFRFTTAIKMDPSIGAIFSYCGPNLRKRQ